MKKRKRLISKPLAPPSFSYVHAGNCMHRKLQWHPCLTNVNITSYLLLPLGKKPRNHLNFLRWLMDCYLKMASPSPLMPAILRIVRERSP